MVSKINDSVRKRGMKVNVGTTKVMIFEKGEGTSECDILIEDKKVELVKEFVCLGSLFINDGKQYRDIEKFSEGAFLIHLQQTMARHLGQVDNPAGMYVYPHCDITLVVALKNFSSVVFLRAM
ncbi:hypothetical protein EVAR_3875_1 [Eumeta japonica]|uniref:Uncharacterized protein n=1 Tax=Eumeta variegata TaxID=151549 RepID=A0A4C1ST42_EUMVA|nr:hypothetical protein EVAR_3875_1 [Eumeta japonica]